MEDKLDNQLNLALSLTPEQRENSQELNVGYDPQENVWEVIFRYVGNLEDISYEVQPLTNEYAIGWIPEDSGDIFASDPRIIYMEKPKSLLLQQSEEIRASCILPVTSPPLSLTGEGVYVAVLDTGIDIYHPDFIEENGNTRIEIIWDQNISGNPPYGFREGSVFTEEEINAALREEGARTFPSRDTNGHGTHVTSICAGNNGVAKGSKILIVKLGRASERGFPSTTQLMTAIDFVIKYSESKNHPISVNVSYGNNYGDHRGNSLLETYIDQMSDVWKNVICIGTGNEGDSGRHKRGVVENREEIQFNIAPFEQSMNLQLWKSYTDNFVVELTSPSGIRRQIQTVEGAAVYDYGDTKVHVYYGSPTPYNVLQEIYFLFLTDDGTIESGQWSLTLTRTRGNGVYQMWLPVSSGTNRGTRFLEPSIDLTLTIPSTARKALSVGAYNTKLISYASFSGRGSREVCVNKPDVVAPGVGILGASPGGGSTVMSGTSMATPFVTGSCALLMEWGIIRGNDPFLYGEKVKAYFQRGAKTMPEFTEYPNDQVGYGRLCVGDSLP